MTPYRDGDRVLIDVQQVIPLPEAEQYVVKIKEKEASERVATIERTSGRGAAFLRFWTTLQARASVSTEMLRTIQPKSGRGFGGRHNGPGMNFNYRVNMDGSIRVDLVIFGCSTARPKEIFDRLFADRAAIEARFGEKLEWCRLDEGVFCRIRYDIPDAIFVDDEAEWPALQDRMIETMISFERSLRPSVVRLGL